MKNSSRFISAVIAVALGAMFIAAKGQSVQIALTVVGAALLIMALVDFYQTEKVMGVFKAIGGVALVILAWAFAKIALYLVSAIIILYGIIQLIFVLKARAQDLPDFKRVLAFTKPFACILAGVCLIFNADGAVPWVFVFSGILIIVEGLLLLVDKTGFAD